jgi:hypothetical protein
MIYQASYEYSSGPLAHGSTIEFMAADARDAAESFKRWFKGRTSRVPEHYKTLLAVLICPLEHHLVGRDGALEPARGWPVFEWNINMRMSYEEKIIWLKWESSK